MILNESEIKERIKKGMIRQFTNLDIQLQANGFDLSLQDISLIKGSGMIDFSNDERKMPDYIILKSDHSKYHLQYGVYLIDFNEYFEIPNDIVALAYSRSSLLRCGAYIPSAIFDAGFHGSVQCILIVSNSYGLELKRNARLLQLVFFERRDDSSCYHGSYNELLNPISEIF